MHLQDITRNTIYVTAPVAATFLIVYSVMLRFLGYGYTLYVSSAIVFTAVAISCTVLGRKGGQSYTETQANEPPSQSRFPAQASVSGLVVLVLVEELLLNSVYSAFGITIALAGFVALPLLASIFGRNDFWQRVTLETVALLFVTRLVVSPFPVGLLSISVYVPIIYTLIIVGISLYVTYRKIPLKEIKLTSAGKNPVRLSILGIGVGIPLGLIEYGILSPGPLFLGATFVQTLGYNIMVLGLFVGIAEELLFRGLLLTSLEKRMKPWQAIGLSSIFFGIMHLGWFNPLEVLFAYGAGVILAYLAYTTKSLTPGIAAHGLDNIVLFLLAAHR